MGCARSVLALGPGWGVRVAGGGERDRARPGQRPDDGFHHHSRPPECRRCPRKRQAPKAKAVTAHAWLLDQDPSKNQRLGPVHRHCPDRRRSLRRQTLRTADGWARPCSKVPLGDKGYDADTILADLDAREAPPSSRPNATARSSPSSTLISTPFAPCRAMLHKTQAQRQTGHSIRQDRRQLHRLRSCRFCPPVGKALNQWA